MASPVVLREIRTRIVTAVNPTHANAASATWTGATKMLPASYDDAGLKQEGFPDDNLKTRLFDAGAPTPGLSRGTYKMSFRGLGSYANTDPTPEQILMNAVCSGIALPTTNRNVAIAAGSSTTIINIATCNSFMRPGQALLIGRKGDGKGNGEVKPILECNAGAAILAIACNAAPAENDPAVISTSIWPDEDGTQTYIEHLAIGAATDDQKQTVGGQGKMGFSGLGMSERPTLDLDMTAADWRTCPTDSRASLQHAVSPQRGTVTFGKGIGLCHVGDYNTATRASFKYAEVSHDPGLAYAEVPGPGGVNGVEGWEKVKGNPKTTLTLLYDEDMPGLASDFGNGQAKHILIQHGHEMGKCFAIEQRKSYVDDSCPAKAAGPLAGVVLTTHGCDDYNASSNIKSAAVVYHMF